MKTITTFLLSTLFLSSCSYLGRHQRYDELRKINLEEVVSFGDARNIGVSVSAKSRIFASFPTPNKSQPFALVEVKEGKTVAFPSRNWNSDKGDSEHRFVRVQDLYVDRNDFLWVLDSKPAANKDFLKNGNTQKNESEETGYFKLVKIDLKTNEVVRVYDFKGLDKKNSALNDVRIDTIRGFAYLSDPGLRGITILNLNSNQVFTHLRNHHSTTVSPDIVPTYDGVEMRDLKNNPFQSHVNGIALSPNSEYFYYKPINSLWLYRIATEALSDFNIPEDIIATRVERVAKVGITHGLLADKEGNIYITNSEEFAIDQLQENGDLIRLVTDKRIIWPDSLGMGTDGYLYFSCAQLNRDAIWNKGKSQLEIPFKLYRIKVNSEEFNL